MKIYAFIFARGGSKGVPKKNIKKICGMPLIYYSIDIAKKIDIVDKIFVSTDDPTIAEYATNYGAQVIRRPKELGMDDSPEWLSWVHAVDFLRNNEENFDIFLNLPTTSPLRNVGDIKRVINSLEDDVDMVITITKSNRSPWFNMVKKINNRGHLVLLNNEENFHRRQDAPVSFDITTVAYATRPEYIKSSKKIFEGKVRGVEIPAERAVDIDTEFDLKVAEFLMQNKKG